MAVLRASFSANLTLTKYNEPIVYNRDTRTCTAIEKESQNIKS